MIDTKTTLDLDGWTGGQTTMSPPPVSVPTIGNWVGEDSARTRRSDPLESHLAADSNNVRDSRAVVLAAFHESRFFADHVLVEFLAASGYTPQRIRTARHELAEAGELELAPFSTTTPTGRAARVWTLRKDAA